MQAKHPVGTNLQVTGVAVEPLETEESPIREDWLAEVQLTEGPLVRFRHVRPDDQPMIAEAIRTASGETLLHRFFSPIRSFPPDRLRQMLTVDRAKGVCVVGVAIQKAAPRIVCGARFVRLGRAGAAEIALTVHDDFQRRGLGTLLLQLLVRLAESDGIGCFEADVMASNLGMIRLLRKLFPAHVQHHSGGDVYHIVIDLKGNPH